MRLCLRDFATPLTRVQKSNSSQTGDTDSYFKITSLSCALYANQRSAFLLSKTFASLSKELRSNFDQSALILFNP